MLELVVEVDVVMGMNVGGGRTIRVVLRLVDKLGLDVELKLDVGFGRDVKLEVELALDVEAGSRLVDGEHRGCQGGA